MKCNPSKAKAESRKNRLCIHPCMKLVCSLTPVRIVLTVVDLLVLKCLSVSISKHCNLEFSYSPLSLFIFFNAITVAIIVGSHRPPIDKVDGVFSYLCPLYEVGASFDNTEECSDVESFEDNNTCGSYGYDEHDDDMDDDLQKRIEDFIAKVNNGWREERLKEKDCKQE